MNPPGDMKLSALYAIFLYFSSPSFDKIAWKGYNYNRFLKQVRQLLLSQDKRGKSEHVSWMKSHEFIQL